MRKFKLFELILTYSVNINCDKKVFVNLYLLSIILGFRSTDWKENSDFWYDENKKVYDNG